MHCGLPNRSHSSERTLFYFTFRRDERALDDQWGQSSLRQSLRDRYTLGGLSRALAAQHA